MNRDQEAIVQKFARLLEKVGNCSDELRKSKDGGISPAPYFEARTSGLNLLARAAGENSIYYRELLNMDGINPGIMSGILTAALTDFREGFMTDHRLLISAEVFSDFLVQAEVLLDHDYKDAAAVIIRAVLEDGIKKLCEAHKIEVEKRETIQPLNEKLYKEKVYTALWHKEIIAKAEIGNCAAQGRFDEYKKEDVEASLEFVLRFLAQYLK